MIGIDDIGHILASPPFPGGPRLTRPSSASWLCACPHIEKVLENCMRNRLCRGRYEPRCTTNSHSHTIVLVELASFPLDRSFQPATSGLQQLPASSSSSCASWPLIAVRTSNPATCSELARSAQHANARFTNESRPSLCDDMLVYCQGARDSCSSASLLTRPPRCGFFLHFSLAAQTYPKHHNRTHNLGLFYTSLTFYCQRCTKPIRWLYRA